MSRRLHALLAAPLLLMSCLSNFYFFCGAQVPLHSTFHQLFLSNHAPLLVQQPNAWATQQQLSYDRAYLRPKTFLLLLYATDFSLQRLGRKETAGERRSEFAMGEQLAFYHTANLFPCTKIVFLANHYTTVSIFYNLAFKIL